MIKNKQDFINIVNKEILQKYNIHLEDFGEADRDVLAYFNTLDKKIYVNKHNKLVFADYVQFIITMQHENVHRLNDAQGLKDVDIDEYEMQQHNKHFRDTFYEKYNVKVTDNFGNANLRDKRNQAINEKLILESFEKEAIFLELQRYYYKKIYVELGEGQKEKNKYIDNGERYVFEEDGGVQI